MPRGTQPFEQDFILVTPTEMRVRQASQYTQLDTHIWQWEAGSSDNDCLLDDQAGEEPASVWETMLSRL